MEWDWGIFVKVAPVVAGVIGAGKLLYDLVIGKRGRMRDEFKFASDFMSALDDNPSMHPYLREKGYQAIAGDSTLEADVIEYLLSLKNGDRALKDYVLGRKYLEHIPTAGNLRIEYKRSYKANWKRRGLLIAYGLAYGACAAAALAPFFLATFYPQKGAKILSMTLFTFPFFAPYAWMSLQAGTRLFRAKKLVENQYKHTQRIVIVTGFQSVRRNASGVSFGASKK